MQGFPRQMEDAEGLDKKARYLLTDIPLVPVQIQLPQRITVVRGIDVVRVIVDANRLGQREDLRNHVIHAEQGPPAVLKVLIDAALRLRSERRPASNRLGPKCAAVKLGKSRRRAFQKEQRQTSRIAEGEEVSVIPGGARPASPC